MEESFAGDGRVETERRRRRRDYSRRRRTRAKAVEYQIDPSPSSYVTRTCTRPRACPSWVVPSSPLFPPERATITDLRTATHPPSTPHACCMRLNLRVSALPRDQTLRRRCSLLHRLGLNQCSSVFESILTTSEMTVTDYRVAFPTSNFWLLRFRCAHYSSRTARSPFFRELYAFDLGSARHPHACSRGPLLHFVYVQSSFI